MQMPFHLTRAALPIFGCLASGVSVFLTSGSILACILFLSVMSLVLIDERLSMLLLKAGGKEMNLLVGFLIERCGPARGLRASHYVGILILYLFTTFFPDLLVLIVIQAVLVAATLVNLRSLIRSQTDAQVQRRSLSRSGIKI